MNEEGVGQTPGIFQIIHDLPKVELHAHGDGSMTAETLFSLVQQNDQVQELLSIGPLMSTRQWQAALGGAQVSAIPLGATQADVTTHEQLRYWVSAHSADSLTEFLAPFGLIGTILKLPGAPTAMALDFISQQAAENVIYSEMRFNPNLLAQDETNSTQAKAVVDEVIAALKTDTSVRVKVILSCLRHVGADGCADLIDVAKTVASEEPSYFAGVDLAADEITFPNTEYINVFQEAAEAGLNVTLHSGEAGDEAPEDCLSAISQMNATRIGHGYQCLQNNDTMDLIKAKGIHIEVAPSSSRGTNAVPFPSIPWSTHPIKQMKEQGVKIGINTDDRGVIGTTMSNEHFIAYQHLGFNETDFRRFAIDAVEAAFTTEDEKASLISTINQAYAMLNITD